MTLSVARGHTLGIVGESGCGKSMVSLSILRLVPPPGRTAAGRVLFDGRDVLAASASELRALRGGRIALVPQDPMTSLNPVFTCGEQIVEAMRVHDRTASRAALRARAVAALDRVRIPAAARRLDDYPHQLSGGMRQRVMIAMALACAPDLLIADEPTTALDVTVQAGILDLLRALQAEAGLAVILITHDLGVVAETADEVAVMYAGRVVERAPAAALFDDPQHPYTRLLRSAAPKPDAGLVPDRVEGGGEVPDLSALPPGCPFEPRCPHAMPTCRAGLPRMYDLGGGHQARCLLHDPATLAAPTTSTALPQPLR